MIFRTDRKPLPWRANSSRDLISPELLKKDGRYRRVALGGRPTELAFAPDGKTALRGQLSRATPSRSSTPNPRKLVQTIPLGGPKTPSLARQGEILFHDASHSHQPVVQLQHLPQRRTHQRPGFRHAQRRPAGPEHLPRAQPQEGSDPPPRHADQALDLARLADEPRRRRWSSRSPRACRAPGPKPKDVKALVAYLDTLEYPRNPYRKPDGGLTPAAKRGQRRLPVRQGRLQHLPRRPRAHRRQDPRGRPRRARRRLSRLQSPSLRGVYDKDPYLHDGRSKTLREALSGPHSADNVTGLGELSDQELDDLIAYLKSPLNLVSAAAASRTAPGSTAGQDAGEAAAT